jgi:hypothetical protein
MVPQRTEHNPDSRHHFYSLGTGGVTLCETVKQRCILSLKLKVPHVVTFLNRKSVVEGLTRSIRHWADERAPIPFGNSNYVEVSAS